jgi:YbbR domain-containing protein
VVPAVDGAPAPGFVVGEVTAVPPTVEVVGPESRLKQLRQATTEPISVDGATQTVTDVVTVGVMDASLRLVEAQNATVTVQVLPAPVTRDLLDVPVERRNLGRGLRAEVTPAAVTVSARGSREVLGGLGAASVTAFVDLAGLGPGQYNLAVRVDPPSDFGISGIAPATATVRIR